MPGAIRVLHVDDEPAFLDLTSTFLERELRDVEVATARSVEAALRRFDEFDPDCVVSDYQMPDAHGLDLLEAVREREPSVPFVLFTGRGSEQVASDAISAGVTDYLQKGSGREQFELLANRIEKAAEAYRTRAAFEETERMVSTLISNLPGMVYRCLNEQAWPMEFVSEGCLDLTGYHPEQLENDDVVWGEDILVQDDQAAMWAEVQAALDEGEPFEVTYRIRRRDGEVRWCWEQGRGVYRGGELVAIEGFITDVTDQRRYRRRLDSLTETAGTLLETPDRHECAWVAVEAACESLEFPIASVRLYDEDSGALEPVAFTDDTAETLEGRLAFPGENGPAWTAFTTGTVQSIADLDGAERTVDADVAVRSLLALPLGEFGVLVLASPAPDAFDADDRNLARILGATLQSAVERADREAALHERERELRAQNERLEEFTNIVSHDLRNPVGVARGQLQLAEATGEAEHFERANEALERVESLVSDMLALAKQGMVVGETEAAHLDVLAHKAWKAVESNAAELVVESNVGLVADTSRLQQLLENLLANAVEHADEGVTISVGRLDDGDGFYVADDGPGIPEADRDVIFDPGYSTDEAGTGFGLAIVEQVARAHDWSVTLTESDAGGARFEFANVTLADNE
ncbi:hybrid sensor histidine kinase/response regulator [Haloarchaeobius amylolyticus]|uniref:hybrid sensor histidine kinase/response regulator n=1 Tax=Haloarchaeobius amylolyticus TaxID=1198296 RepID=UPI00227161F6|nr:response regulator [Haloarchaeobius amylolyticus]